MILGLSICRSVDPLIPAIVGLLRYPALQLGFLQTLQGQAGQQAQLANWASNQST